MGKDIQKKIEQEWISEMGGNTCKKGSHEMTH
jgi:hypothetical protein